MVGPSCFHQQFKVYWSVAIQCTQQFRSQSLNGLLMLTSRGCRMPVSPPGITATSVTVALTASLTPWVRWALNLSQTRRDFSLTRPLGRCCQMLLTHNLHAASSIQPFSFTWILPPEGNLPIIKIKDSIIYCKNNYTYDI